MIPAIIHTLAIVAAFRCRYWAFGLSLLAWFPVMWTWNPYSPDWERTVWIACVIPFTVLQAMAALEAFYRFAYGFALAVRVSIGLGLFSVAAMAWMLAVPSESFIGQVIQTAKYERVGSAVFLILAVAFFGAIGVPLRNLEGLHLCLMTALLFTWMLPAIMAHPSELAWPAVSASAIWARTTILAIWIAAVRGRRSAVQDAPWPSGERPASNGSAEYCASEFGIPR